MVKLAGALLGLLIVLFIAVPLIRYRIGSRHLVISLLGVPFRWVALRNIRYVSDHPKGLTEHWPNTWNPSSRTLYIRKRKGLFKSLRLTPARRFVFKADLEKAIKAIEPRWTSEDTGVYDAS